ncbi:MAG: HlyC/CorC family transporter [Oscillospiraceae bacterium]|nr:HlyC/CorC family transporter [Oscillospiraceae bacterium]
MTVILVALGIFACICCSAFFSASEMAISSCNHVRLENASEDGSHRARTALFLARRFDDSLSAILIGNNLANIAGSSLASIMVILLDNGRDRFAWLATVIMTLLVIIFGETIPKITAKKKATTLSMRYAYIIRACMIVLFPLIWVIVKLIALFNLLIRPDEDQAAGDEAVEELQQIIETAEDEEVIDEDRSELVQAAIDFSDISAYEAMTARVDIQAIDINYDWEKILSSVENANHSRIPVYEGGIDNMIGVLSLNHFLKAVTETAEPISIRPLLMPVCYVYKTMKLPQVLDRLKKAKQHLAVVSDEYGGTLGVITMEDVLEQIVGEIWDETDEVEPEMIRNSEGDYLLDGDMSIAEFIDLMGIAENRFEAESETVGGWTVEKMERFPQPGESFIYDGMQITVLDADERRVEKVLVRRLPEEKEDK